jgi:hypothetical protein
MKDESGHELAPIQYDPATFNTPQALKRQQAYHAAVDERAKERAAVEWELKASAAERDRINAEVGRVRDHLAQVRADFAPRLAALDAEERELRAKLAALDEVGQRA